MTTKIVVKNNFQVIGYRFEANLQEIEQGKLGEKTLARLQKNADKINNKCSHQVYLIQLYPLKEHFNAFEDRFTQIIGYEVVDAISIPEGMIVHQVPENLYVTYTHRGLEANLHHTYDYLYDKWMCENKYMPLGYDFEIWDERYQPESTENEIDLFVAIKSN